MIDRAELLRLADELGLEPRVVEKDYVLGWVLAGIFRDPLLANSWVFKGGTCLKKCYFETYRFSEDLDFTIRDPAQLTANPAQIPNVKSLSPFGCNDNGAVVGSYIANDGTVHGFVFDGTDWHNYDAAGSSQRAAFGVMGTFINGINNAGNIVGFFSDGQNVNGFVDFVPVQ